MQPPTVPDPAVIYSRPMRGRLAVLGLQGASVADLLHGGLPSQPYMTEPAGDALQVDVPVTLSNTSPGRGDRYGGVGSAFPDPSTLDYVHKAASATLLLLVLGLLVVYAVLRPQKALRLVEGRAGGGG